MFENATLKGQLEVLEAKLEAALYRSMEDFLRDTEASGFVEITHLVSRLFAGKRIAHE